MMAKIFPLLSYISFVLLQQLQQFQPPGLPYLDYLVQGGIAGVLLFIWYHTTKSTERQTKQIYEQMNKTTDAILEIVKEDTKYKALLAQTLTSLEDKIDNIKK